ncbi:protein O-mannosyl-transferase family [Bacteroides thetaiotaomicron]|uniref:protein O-mannosyl-transferase family n=1 Tax=Bacteroides thetaiotaomicron TaxID=818 RepID=UPI0039C1A952
MKQYRTINNLVGWITFIIAATVYCLTIEPTASFWDCPEFITTGYKLEVGHPPGAPFFMLVANLFSQFASDVTTVAKMVNYMSALMSGACILFLFWSITHLVRKLVITDENNITKGQLITVMGSGLVGALVYTFSDTFWFSAVEGEVYAFSSLFTAVVFWLILKWEDVANQPHSDRWLILIAYLTGLSIGVHLLNLLCLPAIVLVYYYKKTPNATAKGSLLALLGSGVLVAAVLYGIVPGIVKVGGWFELLFVNGLGMSFNSGVVVYIILLAAALIWGVYESYTEKSRLRMAISFILTIALLGIPFYGHGVSSILIGVVVIAILGIYLAPQVQEKIKEKWRISARTMNTALLCTMMIVIGYSSYALIVIRSTANTPMDQNSPEDIFTLGEYLGREQYGTRPLFYGPAFSSKVALDVKDGYCVPRQSQTGSKYVRKEKTSPDEKDSYIELPGRIEYEYAQNMLFPRMYSSAHSSLYKQWVDIKGHDVPYDQCGEMVMVNVPNQWENIKFFFSYQLNFMYWRYFMWNFAGRQNDIQSSGEIEHGNWITGIPFIDNLLVGNQELLPQDLKNNKGHNVFYCLPLLLGLIGLFWQAYHSQRGIQQFWVVFFLFFMTGIAIVLYLNQTPAQPRERDYAYAGSFYAFAIWVGMGVAGIIRMLRDYCKMKEVPAAALASVLCLLVPIQMAGQTWDDHDRSGRFVARDFGQNYLMTLQEEGNPIIFTNGDNDTFPLWYNQETEGFRTDARTCNLSYLQTDWYIDQMKRPAYDSPSLPITWDRVEYVEGQNEYIPIRPEVKKNIDQMYAQADSALENGNPEAMNELKEQFGENPYELKNILKYWVRSDKEGLRVIPTDSIVMKIDKEAVRRSGMKIPEALDDSIPEYMTILLRDANGNPKRALYKSELMMLEMLANANWERPIYMAITVGSENHLGMDNHFTQEGLAYRFTPFDTDKLNSKIDSEKMYDNLMNKFKFGGIEKPGIYIDENVMRMCYTHRRIFTQLVGQLIKEGKKDKALAALDYAEKMIPSYNVPYDWANGAFQMAEAYYQLGQNEKANKIIDELANKSLEYMIWYLSLTDYQLSIASENFMYNAGLLDAEVRLMEKYKSEELAKHYSEQLDQLYNEYVARMKGK